MKLLAAEIIKKSGKDSRQNVEKIVGPIEKVELIRKDIELLCDVHSKWNKAIDQYELDKEGERKLWTLYQDFMVVCIDLVELLLEIVKNEQSPQVCPNCGCQLPAYAKFCGKCGTPLKKEQGNV